MKKSIIILFLLCCVVCLCACGLSTVEIPPLPTATPVPNFTIAPTPTPVPTIVPAGLEHRVIIRIQDVLVMDNDPEYDMTPILNFRVQTPVVSIADNDAAAETINTAIRADSEKYMPLDLNSEEVGVVLDKYTEMLSLAQDNYSSETQTEEMKFFRHAQILRADDNLISIEYTNTTNRFGQETEETETHYYDTTTGTELSETLITGEGYASAEKKGTGTLNLVKAQNSPTEIVDLVVLDEDGDDYLLTCDGIIYDLYVGDDWYCNVLNNASVQIKAKLPEGMPALLISYLSGGELVNSLFAKDLDTGEAVLTDASTVSAVG